VALVIVTNNSQRQTFRKN